MKLRKRLKKSKRKHLFIKDYTKNTFGNLLTGYAARLDPICTICKRHKPLNWWVKTCADITCKGRYKVPKRELITNKIKVN